MGPRAQVIEFFRTYVGPRSSFAEAASSLSGYPEFVAVNLLSLLDSFIVHLESGLFSGVSPERQGQLDVVSDFLEQANTLLNDSNAHPGSAAMLVGASLEEYLRTWIEAEGLSLENKRPGIDSYSKVLREAELISKQDIKDITAWAGIRNHAAHGEWNEVEDRARIRLMLEGVNLFMRKNRNVYIGG